MTPVEMPATRSSGHSLQESGCVCITSQRRSNLRCGAVPEASALAPAPDLDWRDGPVPPGQSRNTNPLALLLHLWHMSGRSFADERVSGWAFATEPRSSQTCETINTGPESLDHGT